MSKDLTNSEIDRQNILNNPYALAEIEILKLKIFNAISDDKWGENQNEY
jgi:hypothetical protein